MRYKRSILFTLVLLAAFIGYTGFWLRAQQRQYALNRQLIAALVRGDDDQALGLIDEGADPNTHYGAISAPTLKRLWDHLLHRSTSLPSDDPTAFLIACGAWWRTQTAFPNAQADTSDHATLVKEMLDHGANINVSDETGWTPLLWALNADLKNTVVVLLEHGAGVNSKTDGRWTPLMVASRSSSAKDIVPLLLKRGAEVNARDKDGGTALTWAEWSSKGSDIIGQLLTHGADPNLADQRGDTPLKLAQRNKCHDIVALLKRYGARK